jgi:hypothetical protein
MIPRKDNLHLEILEISEMGGFEGTGDISRGSRCVGEREG